MSGPLIPPVPLLTDDPVWAAGTWGAEVDVSGPTDAESVWWDVLGAPRKPSRGTVPGLALRSKGTEPLVVALRRAAGSQYRAVRDSLTVGAELSRPLVCLAGSGDRFEGQSGRPWQALAGNLHLTVAVPCDLPAGPGSLVLNAVPAVAVQGALQTLRPGPEFPAPGIKWVNDILLEGHKVAGVLTSVRSQGGRVTAILFGIGLNVAVAPRLEPSIFTPGASSLRDAWGQATPDLGTLLRRILQELCAGLDHLEAGRSDFLVEAYRDASILRGRRVGIWPAETPDGPAPDTAPVVTGIVRGVGPDLGLVLEGGREPIREGRLAILA